MGKKVFKLYNMLGVPVPSVVPGLLITTPLANPFTDPLPKAVAVGHMAITVNSEDPIAVVIVDNCKLNGSCTIDVPLEVYTVAVKARGMIPAISVSLLKGGITFLRPGWIQASIYSLSACARSVVTKPAS